MGAKQRLHVDTRFRILNSNHVTLEATESQINVNLGNYSVYFENKELMA